MNLSSIHPAKFGIILSFCILVVACKAGKPTRKTLPDYIYGEAAGRPGEQFDEQNDLPFYATDTLIKNQNFIAICLRNPEFDSLAINLVELYRPFARSVIKTIEYQGLKGVVLDFRRSSDRLNSQANFRVAETGQPGNGDSGTTALDFIFLWDENFNCAFCSVITSDAAS